MDDGRRKEGRVERSAIKLIAITITSGRMKKEEKTSVTEYNNAFILFHLLCEFCFMSLPFPSFLSLVFPSSQPFFHPFPGRKFSPTFHPSSSCNHFLHSLEVMLQLSFPTHFDSHQRYSILVAFSLVESSFVFIRFLLPSKHVAEGKQNNRRNSRTLSSPFFSLFTFTEWRFHSFHCYLVHLTGVLFLHTFVPKKSFFSLLLFQRSPFSSYSCSKIVLVPVPSVTLFTVFFFLTSYISEEQKKEKQGRMK